MFYNFSILTQLPWKKFNIIQINKYIYLLLEFLLIKNKINNKGHDDDAIIVTY